MLTYPRDSDETRRLFEQNVRERMELNRYLDEALKSSIIRDAAVLSDAMREMAPISEAIRQVADLKSMKGILIADTEEAILSSVQVEHFRPAFLTDEKIRFLPKKRRIAMAQSLLKIMQRLSEKEIFPGVIRPNAVVYDESGVSDEVFLSRISLFQLGKLRQTWTDDSDENYIEDNYPLNAMYPFFDQTHQNVANARLINRLIRDSRLTSELEDDDDHSPESLSELLTEMEEELLRPATVRTGVWIVYPDLTFSGDPQRLTLQTALLNNLLLSSVPRGSGCQLSVNYIRCGSACDIRGGSGAVCSTGMKRFDGTFLPYLDWSGDLSGDLSGDRSKLMLAYVAAEYEMTHSDFDRKLLLILAPTKKDFDISCILNYNADSGENACAVLYDSQCDWGLQRVSYAFKTDEREGLRLLRDRISSIVAPDV